MVGVAADVLAAPYEGERCIDGNRATAVLAGGGEADELGAGSEVVVYFSSINFHAATCECAL